LKKILIVKMGYSETLDKETSKVVSLGDVLRCTVILEPIKQKYSNSEITWLVSKEAVPLVTHNKNIDRILVWDEFVPYVLMRESYDMVINLEKIHGICALVDMINAWEKVGFRFDSNTGDFDTYLQSEVAKSYIAEKDFRRSIWQEIIIKMIGSEWTSQEYDLGYKPKSEVTYDIGFNYFVGKKWPTKAMPKTHWEKLEDKLKSEGFTITWQEGLDNLYEYIDWINKSKLIISSDSLGLHIALALKKSVISIFGPTDEEEVFFYNRGEAIGPVDSFKCENIPCFKPECQNDSFCMDNIDINKIFERVKHWM